METLDHQISQHEAELDKLRQEVAAKELQLLGLYREAHKARAGRIAPEPVTTDVVKKFQEDIKASLDALSALGRPEVPSAEIRPVRTPDGSVIADMSAVYPLVRQQYVQKNGRPPSDIEMEDIVRKLREQVERAMPEVKAGQRLSFTIPQT